jgi:hypothetical protein
VLCGCVAEDPGSTDTTIEVRGDTTFVLLTEGPTRRVRLEPDPSLEPSDSEHLFGHVNSIHVDRTGEWLVVDGMNPAVVRLASDGRYLGQVGRPGQGPGEFGNPWGVTTDLEGRIYVADYDGTILVFERDGRFLTSWQAPRRTHATEPVVANEDGTVMVASPAPPEDQGPWVFRVYFFQPDGSLLDSITPHILNTNRCSSRLSFPVQGKSGSSATHPRAEIQTPPRR